RRAAPTDPRAFPTRRAESGADARSPTTWPASTASSAHSTPHSPAPTHPAAPASRPRCAGTTAPLRDRSGNRETDTSTDPRSPPPPPRPATAPPEKPPPPPNPRGGSRHRSPPPRPTEAGPIGPPPAPPRSRSYTPKGASARANPVPTGLNPQGPGPVTSIRP